VDLPATSVVAAGGQRRRANSKTTIKGSQPDPVLVD